MENSDPRNGGESGSRIRLPDRLRDLGRSRSGWFDEKKGDFPFSELGVSISELGSTTDRNEFELRSSNLDRSSISSLDHHPTTYLAPRPRRRRADSAKGAADSFPQDNYRMQDSLRRSPLCGLMARLSVTSRTGIGFIA